MKIAQVGIKTYHSLQFWSLCSQMHFSLLHIHVHLYIESCCYCYVEIIKCKLSFCGDFSYENAWLKDRDLECIAYAIALLSFLCLIFVFVGHFGHVRLPEPIFHPTYVRLLQRMLQKICLGCGTPKPKKMKVIRHIMQIFTLQLEHSFSEYRFVGMRLLNFSV